MQSEIDSLRQRITELEAEKAELEAKNSELLKRVIEETAKYKAENVELKARIEELEKNKMETAELRDRFTIVEQRQMLNESVPLGLPKGNNSSDKDSSNFNFSSTSVIEEKSSEEKDIDKFLDDAHKKREKIQRETGIQDVAPDPACTSSESPREIEDHTQNAIAIDSKINRGRSLLQVNTYYPRLIPLKIRRNRL
ncbi:hypothetical protein GLOIN_2v1736025 [Rhizophagus irregularis DAOM 181602=DAOM 197198]|uniref:Uncharacterized protein n=1 Tax=Rhizophagus irregularis (strain DAOM 181602 / DAOM 197198 / MUCL 43194) TaxID=747089 RepID=A0A2P4NXJ2_RHIID|nr:hypothetical protein GLOIN_2v1736025 [Rhizophagus irregularis DAOM 181602=DAOM 197198]POG57860.1 hypothetical protein GLOIN_2v1736025 [Rhizophagus irregularis DAOM 181602=DAOM 197198]|eukprot:XP_025164726.1 hypothetical protein GLOIN_2v1736025 [Rhizophagus irregularis DAOM 181602=DAOM 197198]